jgi:hypothetical protein
MRSKDHYFEYKSRQPSEPLESIKQSLSNKEKQIQLPASSKPDGNKSENQSTWEVMRIIILYYFS